MKKLKLLLKRRRKNSGFTLVEMIVSCGLLGILVLGVTIFITPVLRSAASNEKNVRATLLAETVNNYISRSTRNALFVQIFTNADRTEATKSDGVIAKDENLLKMQEYVDKRLDSEGKKVFELKCISFSWDDDPQTLEEKFMLMNETFINPSSTVINSEPIHVFENCFYDGLYTKFIVEQLLGTDVAPTGSSDDSSTSDPDEKKPVPAIKITAEVYSNQDMIGPEFIGVGYTEYATIKSKINEDGTYKFYDIKSLESEDPHSTTFIYYVARKTTASEIVPGTSSSTT